MSVWNALRRSVSVEKPKADPAWDRFFEEVVATEKGSKPVSPRAAMAPAPMPRRSWFARTFIEPVERLLKGAARVVVIVVAIAVSGMVTMGLIGTLAPSHDAARPSTHTAAPVSAPSPVATTQREDRPGFTWVDEHTRDGKTVKGHWRKLTPK